MTATAQDIAVLNAHRRPNGEFGRQVRPDAPGVTLRPNGPMDCEAELDRHARIGLADSVRRHFPTAQSVTLDVDCRELTGVYDAEGKALTDSAGPDFPTREFDGPHVLSWRIDWHAMLCQDAGVTALQGQPYQASVDLDALAGAARAEGAA